MEVKVPGLEMTPLSKANFATEVAFGSLIKEASGVGLALNPVMGLMYLPDAAVTRQFQEACRAVLNSLAADTKPEPPAVPAELPVEKLPHWMSSHVYS